jgi:hypothetical protein
LGGDVPGFHSDILADAKFRVRRSTTGFVVCADTSKLADGAARGRFAAVAAGW